jgi:hypothetical protein
MYGLDSIRRFQAGGEAFSDDVVRDYIRSLADSSGNIRESDIAAAMSTFGVSPAQVARATGADPGYVSQQYSNYLAEPPPPPPPTPAAVDPVAQQYANDFNALINQGNYEDAARVVKEAELAGYGDEAYRAAAVALGAKANLPGGSDFIQPEGIQSIRDYVANVTNVDEFNKLIRDEEFGKAAAFAQSQGFTPDQVATYINENAANLGLSEGFGVTGENIATLYPGYVAPDAAPVDLVAQNLLDRFNAFMGAGDFAGAANILKEGEGVYGGEVYNVASNYLNTDPRFAGLREQIGIGQKDTPAFDANNLRSFVESQLATEATPVTSVTPEDEAAVPTAQTTEDEAAVPTAQTTPGPGQIYGIPRFERQTQSNVPFAPLRRGLAQLRPAMYMPGLTSGQAPLGGSGFTPESLRNAIQSMTAAGQTPADVAYQMDVGGVSPAELSAAIGTPVGQIQAQYNQSRPRGLFSTGVPAPRGLPEDFVLQTGAYGAPTPTFFTPTPAKTTSPSESSSANANQPGSISGDGSGDSAGPDPGGFDAGTDSPASVSTRAGGIIKMAEGGGPPKMAELSAKEAGSTFDISKYIDDEGRLVGGYSKPIYDENRVITGYDYRPYERDVVFGELRDKEAAMQLTDAEREQMMIEMAMRQGRTGILPTTGGLAGIEIGDPMMRNRPQYYSTVEQFRPRYAEGGNVSSTAQDLASRGRGGDTMLVHMAPHEVAGLNALARMQGTELTINPETGMPEALKLGKLFKTLAPFIPFIPGVGQFLAPAFGALGMGGFSPLLQKAITSGIVGGFTGPKGGFDLQRGLMQGITAYGLGSLQQNLGGPSTPGGPPAPTGPAVSPELGAVDASVTSQNPLLAPGVGDNASLSALERAELGIRPPIDYTPGDITAASKAAEATRAGFPLSDVERGGVSDLGAPFEYEPVSPKNAATTASGMKTPTALLTTGLGLSSTADYDKLTSAGIAVKREKEEEDELYRRLFERSLGAVPVRSGGLMKLAGGGMSYMEAGGTTGPTGAPREVVGNGDGMSDSVPADIEGVQEARLADGEFVIPADVVADIGNGSSDAGSKKLYDMMDRVRKARHGTTEQPPEIKAERLMPA